MKKLYSTIMMLAMMVAALGFTACGGDDEDEDGSIDDNGYFQVTINDEMYSYDYFGGALLVNYGPKVRNGEEVYTYGGMSESIPISYQDDVHFHVIGGYVSDDFSKVYPNSTGTYDVLSTRGEYIIEDFSDRVGMFISGGNMNRRTVTSGSLKITKTRKIKYSGYTDYVTEGTFSFVLTDDWNGNENKISGKFKIVY